MNFNSIGDMAQAFALRRQTVELKSQMDRLTLELSSGQAADLTRHLSGNLLHLADVEHELLVQDSHRTAAREAAVDATTMQSSLDLVQSLSTDLANSAITVGFASGGVPLSTLSTEAKATLGSIIGALNTDVAGRALFSGSEIDRTSLAPADQVLDEVRTALAGATSAAGVLSALDTFFDTPGGGFETSIYRGGSSNLSAYQLGAGESVALDIRADDPVLRGFLKQTVLSALVDDPALALGTDDRRALARSASQALLTQQDGLSTLRADLGVAEARIDQSTSRIGAEITSLQIARNNLVSIDVFETAGDLEQVQFQLETLYTLTARASRLSLVNFLS
ncbi:MAG: flagellin [Roseovarius sp.]|nr:flagellin [Roseovarius sp.]